MPSDFGEQPIEVPGPDGADTRRHTEPSEHAPPGSSKPGMGDLGAQIKRPAIWGLIVLIAVVVAIQIWLLFL